MVMKQILLLLVVILILSACHKKTEHPIKSKQQLTWYDERAYLINKIHIPGPDSTLRTRAYSKIFFDPDSFSSKGIYIINQTYAPNYQYENSIIELKTSSLYIKSNHTDFICTKHDYFDDSLHIIDSKYSETNYSYLQNQFINEALKMPMKDSSLSEAIIDYSHGNSYSQRRHSINSTYSIIHNDNPVISSFPIRKSIITNKYIGFESTCSQENMELFDTNYNKKYFIETPFGRINLWSDFYSIHDGKWNRLYSLNDYQSKKPFIISSIGPVYTINSTDPDHTIFIGLSSDEQGHQSNIIDFNLDQKHSFNLIFDTHLLLGKYNFITKINFYPFNTKSMQKIEFRPRSQWISSITTSMNDIKDLSIKVEITVNQKYTHNYSFPLYKAILWKITHRKNNITINL